MLTIQNCINQTKYNDVFFEQKAKLKMAKTITLQV